MPDPSDHRDADERPSHGPERNGNTWVVTCAMIEAGVDADRLITAAQEEDDYYWGEQERIVAVYLAMRAAAPDAGR